MVLLIDNYDSFSYNLFQYVGEMESDIKVIRNDELTVEEIAALKPDRIILSPGPGKPAEAGVCIDVVKKLSGKIPILGVCLGHQAICEAFGATVSYADKLMHGKQSEVTLDNGCSLFSGIPEKTTVARYHSLIAIKNTMPDCLKITAETAEGEIMAVQHKEHSTYGLQFHPESIMTPEGKTILRNFLSVK